VAAAVRRLGDERGCECSVSQVTHVSLTPGSERNGGIHHQSLADEGDRAQARVRSVWGLAVGLQEDDGDRAATSLPR